VSSDSENTSFITHQVIRFGDVDPAGIVYFPRVYDLIHQAFEDLWNEHVGERYYKLIAEKQFGFPLVHSEVDFKRPLLFGDRPEVSINCTKLGRSSIGLHYVYRVDGQVCVEARMTVVCVALKTMKSMELPAPYRERFKLILSR